MPLGTMLALALAAPARLDMVAVPAMLTVREHRLTTLQRPAIRLLAAIERAALEGDEVGAQRARALFRVLLPQIARQALPLRREIAILEALEARATYRIPAPAVAVRATRDGLTLAVASYAEVVAPAGGRIAFAGPFRGYGGTVIVDHGHGWTSLLTGLGTLAVATGTTVGPGAGLGRADTRQDLTLELRHRGRQVDALAMARQLR